MWINIDIGQLNVNMVIIYREWCYNNIGESSWWFQWYPCSFYFNDSEDATAFKLRFQL